MKKFLLTIVCTILSLSAFAQAGGMKGVVVSRDDREPISGVAISVEGLDISAQTDTTGEFTIAGLEPGQYQLTLVASGYEDLVLMVRVKEMIHDMQQVVMVPSTMVEVDESAFAELDTDVESAGDSNAMPSALSASKDIFNSIACD